MAFVVEVLGTFFLTLVAAMTANPLAIGGVLTALVYSGGKISGGHYNPAVSLGALVTGKINVLKWAFYAIAQTFGAIAASLLYRWFSGRSFMVYAPSPKVWLQMMVLEFIFTFLLVLTVVLTTAKENQYFGLAIGLALMTGVFAGQVTGGGFFNPALVLAASLTDLPVVKSGFVGFIPYVVVQLAAAGSAGLLGKLLASAEKT